MSLDRIADIVLRARLASTSGIGGAQGIATSRAGEPGSTEAVRQRLERVAAEFESMLLTQMLRDMRKTGSWKEDGEDAGLGAETFYETLDVELAGHLARVQGLGLSKQLVEAFERLNGATEDPGPRPAEQAAPRPAANGQPSETSHVDAAEARLPAFLEAFATPPGAVTSSFGWRRDPLHGHVRFHRGVDIRAAYAQEIQAAAVGRVVFSGVQGGYGTTVLVEHEGGVQTRYAHLSAALVSAGDLIERGQILGRAGNSGRATGTHLHFEVIAHGHHVDPQQWEVASPAAVAAEALPHPARSGEAHVRTPVLKLQRAFADQVGEPPTGIQETQAK